MALHFVFVTHLAKANVAPQALSKTII